MFDVVDFNKNCEAHRGRYPLPLSGMPVYYHRCPACGVIFTVAFDDFSTDDFLRHIYNDGYETVDPDYVTVRPQGNARFVSQTFGKTPNISILDYGGGNGRSAELIRRAGFTDVTVYDPFVPAAATVPTRKFDLVLCIEVVEHTHTPLKTFDQMADLVSASGLVMFTTNTQPPEVEKTRLDWWYAAPRNGHVTLYSQTSLHRIASRLGMTYRTNGGGVHALFRAVPEFARHLFGG